MKIINANSSNEDSFKYSILWSLHYCDINRNPESISKLKPFENKYNFTHNTATEFELDKPNISLTVFDENNEIIYISNNGSRSSNKAKIVKINNYRHAAIKPLKSNSIKLNEFMQLHSHLELRDLFFQNSRRNNITNLILLIFLWPNVEKYFCWYY